MNLKTSILDYINDVKSGSFTVEEFTSATIQRIKDVDGDVHAYLSLNESAIEDARIIAPAFSREFISFKAFHFSLNSPKNIVENILSK